MRLSSSEHYIIYTKLNQLFFHLGKTETLLKCHCDQGCLQKPITFLINLKEVAYFPKGSGKLYSRNDCLVIIRAAELCGVIKMSVFVKTEKITQFKKMHENLDISQYSNYRLSKYRAIHFCFHTSNAYNSGRRSA